MTELDSIPLFSPLGPGELAALREVVRQQAYRAGTEIFKEGDLGDGIYFVRDGEVEISALVSKESRKVFSKVGPGEMFGELAVIDNKPRSAWAVASRDTEVYFISREAAQELIVRSPVLALGLMREISNRIREFNRQYLDEVLQIERLAVLGRFSRSIVHDLKNPLNIIGISAELAGMETATKETRDEARIRIRKQVDRISDMIGEILDFTQGGRSAFILAPTDYGSFVKGLAEELSAEVQMKSARLELEEPLPQADLLLDPKRLRRVFYNLIHNATDAMPEGGTIRLRVLNSDGEVVTEIEDSGPGIAPEIANHLFEAFATYGKAHGTGLGLSICKRIVEDHQGWIKARTEPGRGAIFSFGLPLRTAKAGPG